MAEKYGQRYTDAWHARLNDAVVRVLSQQTSGREWTVFINHERQGKIKVLLNERVITTSHYSRACYNGIMTVTNN